MANQAPVGNYTYIDDDTEEIVIVHPHPPGTAATVPPHVHHARAVICKADAKEIVIGPVGGYAKTHKYKRTEERDSSGRTIFVEAK